MARSINAFGAAKALLSRVRWERCANFSAQSGPSLPPCKPVVAMQKPTSAYLACHRQQFPSPLLLRKLRIEVENHLLVERQYPVSIRVCQHWRGSGEHQPPPGVAGGNGEGRGDPLLAPALVAHCLGSAELVKMGAAARARGYLAGNSSTRPSVRTLDEQEVDFL